MMEYNKEEKTRKRLALAASACFHALLLLGAYYLTIRQAPDSSSSGYSIELKNMLDQEVVSKATTIDQVPPANEQPLENTKQAAKTAKEAAAKVPTDTMPTMQAHPSKEATQEQVVRASEPAKASTTPSKEEETLDDRGLYTINQDKPTGARLELAGWVWDAVPQPQDNTEESGKIVFEIKIDELGEVIAVKTLEKTVSPLVEKIYKESLIKLTFSKTADNTVDTPTSTGKVTFIIQAK